jgi:hypothetical protein
MQDETKHTAAPAAADAGPEPDALDPEGRYRPRFVLSFPADPELDELVALFENGDFATLSERAPKLAASSADPRVRAACKELVRRTRPDPTVKLMLAIAIGFCAFLLLWTYW